MAQVKSTFKLALGERIPNFSLPSTNGCGTITLTQELADHPQLKGIVIVFTCNHCPFAKHIADSFNSIAKTYGEKGFHFIAINSNDSEAYPEDSPERMKQEAETRQFVFPYLFDVTQEVAKQYFASCTPDFFVATPDGNLYYRGCMDETTPSNPGSGADGKHLIAALEGILASAEPPHPQIPSIGCNIKWKPGGEPAYF